MITKFIRTVGTLFAHGPWYCTICGAMYSSDAEGAAHMASAHPNLQ
jgi:hypothetical protein